MRGGQGQQVDMMIMKAGKEHAAPGVHDVLAGRAGQLRADGDDPVTAGPYRCCPAPPVDLRVDDQNSVVVAGRHQASSARTRAVSAPSSGAVPAGVRWRGGRTGRRQPLAATNHPPGLSSS